MTGKEFREKHGGDPSCIITDPGYELFGVEDVVRIRVELNKTIDRARELAQALHEAVMGMRITDYSDRQEMDNRTTDNKPGPAA